eukprot:467707-Prymnesium_polylepis.1
MSHARPNMSQGHSSTRASERRRSIARASPGPDRTTTGWRRSHGHTRCPAPRSPRILLLCSALAQAQPARYSWLPDAAVGTAGVPEASWPLVSAAREC